MPLSSVEVGLMSDAKMTREPHFDSRESLARLDAVANLIDMERMVSEGAPVGDFELERELAACIDMVMAQEESWLSKDF